MKIPIGTRSLIYGSHQFFLHPLFVMYAWIELYRWTLDPRIWMAAIVHDWGYWGCKTIDGGDGKYHPTLGGWIMLHLFGTEWAKFTMYHSREYAQMNFAMPSPLAAADRAGTSPDAASPVSVPDPAIRGNRRICAGVEQGTADGQGV